MAFAFRWPRVRARGLVLTVLLVVVAAVLWRNARDRRAADAGAVAEWIREAARAAQEDRDAPPAMGGTEPVIASAFAAWVRGAMPPGRAGDPRVEVDPLGGGPFGTGDGDATHRARIGFRGGAAEADIRWADRASGVPAMVAFRTAPADPAAPGPDPASR
jgi:hypothetical protein